jgi:hypothetical protein
MSEQDINIDDFKFERIGGFIPTREEATYGLGNFFKALGDKFNIKDPSVRSGDATYYDIAESFIGKPTYRNEAFDTGSRDTGFGLADITPLGALYALDEAVNKLPERVKNNPLALLSIMRQPLQTTVETFDTDKFRDNAPLGENNMNLLPIDIATAGVGTTPFVQPLGALARETLRATAKAGKTQIDAINFLRRQANKKPPDFDNMKKATMTGKPVSASDKASVKPTTTDVDLSKAKPEFMKVKPTKTMSMVQPNLTPDDKFFSGGELDDFAVQRFYNERLPKNRNLMVHHNINQIDLIKADRLGGLPAPSLAISKIDNPMMGYGDVVLVGSTKLAKPSYSNPVFRSDGYTVRMPKPDITINRPLMEFVKNEKVKFFKSFNRPAKIKRFLESKPDYQKLRGDEKLRLQKRFRNFISATEKHHLEVKEDMGQPSDDSIDLARGFEDRADNPFIKTMYAVENKLVSDNEILDAYFTQYINNGYIRDVKGNKTMKDIFEDLANTEKGLQSDAQTARYSGTPTNFDDISKDVVDPSVDPKYENWLINKRKDILAEGGEIKERLFVDYTPDGSRRIYLPATLKNFVKLMKKRRGAGEENMFLQGMGQLRAKITPPFRTISEIKAERSRITTSEEFNKERDELQNLYEDVINLVGNIADDVFKKNNTTATQMVDMRTTEELFEDIMLGRLGTHEYSKNYDKPLKENKELQAKVKELKEKLISLPTEYFEAKPMRGVKLDEFVGAIVPEDVSPQVEAILKKNGLRVEKYAYDDSYGISEDELSAEEFAREKELPTKQNLFKRFPEVLFSIGAGASILPEIQKRNSLKMNEAPLT